MVDEVFEFLVTRIEGSMRELLETDLALYPADKWKAKGWDFIDSLDPKREWDGFSYVDMPNPLKGMEVRDFLSIKHWRFWVIMRPMCLWSCMMCSEACRCSL